MARNDVSGQERSELPKLVQSMLDEIPPAILSIKPEALSSFEQNKLESADLASEWMIYQVFRQKSKNLTKLSGLLLIWQSRLDDIVRLWIKGDLKDKGLSAEDVRNLIWALFEHSERREDAIATIMAT